MRLALLIPLVLLAACQKYDPIGTGNDMDDANQSATALNPGAKPVRIGESGAGFDACIARGNIVGLAKGETVPLRAAPLSAADKVADLVPEQRLFVCTRSIDQRWLGVVILPSPSADSGSSKADPCGVDTSVDHAQNYPGPCTSGWVQSALVRMSAD